MAQVDFNAGVVAAGEAQIESTVMGNAPELLASDPHRALVDRGQVFLPTNNALSPVGHVHWYLEELGQGIQVRAPPPSRNPPQPVHQTCSRAPAPRTTTRRAAQPLWRGLLR